MASLWTYFSDIPIQQQQLLEQYVQLIKEWNSRINLVSRKDIESFEWHHLAPCLCFYALLKDHALTSCNLWDVGTGGGLPGIPLAILFKEATFTLIDSIGKKIIAVQDMAQRLNLQNVTCIQNRIEKISGGANIITGRAVTALPEFLDLVTRKIKPKPALPFDVLYLTGEPQSSPYTPGWKIEYSPLTRWLPLPFFEGKALISAKHIGSKKEV